MSKLESWKPRTSSDSDSRNPASRCIHAHQNKFDSVLFALSKKTRIVGRDSYLDRGTSIYENRPTVKLDSPQTIWADHSTVKL